MKTTHDAARLTTHLVMTEGRPVREIVVTPHLVRLIVPIFDAHRRQGNIDFIQGEDLGEFIGAVVAAGIEHRRLRALYVISGTQDLQVLADREASIRADALLDQETEDPPSGGGGEVDL